MQLLRASCRFLYQHERSIPGIQAETATQKKAKMSMTHDHDHDKIEANECLILSVIRKTYMIN